MDAWTVSYKNKIKELCGFLECANNVSSAGCMSALDATRNLLSTAVLLLTSSRYQLNEISVIRGNLETSFDSLLLSEQPDLQPQRRLSIQLTNLFDVSNLIKKEPGSEAENTPVGKLLTTRNDCFLCLAFKKQTVTFNAEDDLWHHVEERHVVERMSGLALTCAWCPKQYVLNRDDELWGSASRLFIHLTSAHSDDFSCPTYVSRVSCDSQGCSFTAYTHEALRQHAQTDHVPSRPATQIFYDESGDDEASDADDREYRMEEGDEEEEEEEEEEMSDGKDTSFSRRPPRLSGNKESLSRKVEFAENRCFLCESEPLFATENLVMDHIREKHLRAVGRGFVLECGSCSKSYKMTKSKTMNSCLSESLSRYLGHVTEVHEAPTPSYVSCYKCSECEFSAFSPYILHQHTSRPHKRRFKATPRKRKRSFEEDDEVVTPTTGKVSRNLQFSTYQCFICEGERVFAKEEVWLDHVRSEHLVTSGISCFLNCSQCPKQYSFKQLRMCKSYLNEALSRLLQHSVHVHNRATPGYVNTFPCSDCSYIAFSPHILTLHLRKHSAGSSPGFSRTPSLTPKEGKKYLKKIRIEEGSDEEIDSVLTFHPLSSGEQASVDMIAATMSDRKLCVTEDRCFLCQGEEFVDISELRNHWKTAHLDMSGVGHAYLVCPHCTYTLKLTLPKCTPGNVCELMSSLCQHIAIQHSVCGAIPEYVVRMSCPMAGCHMQFFSLQMYRQHVMRVHQLFTSNEALLRGKYYVLLANSPLIFTTYKCFICDDNTDMGNIVGYLNHWVTQHFDQTANIMLLDCAHCGTRSDSCTMQADQIISCIIRYAQHLEQSHDIELPAYLLPASQVTPSSFHLTPDAKHYLVVKKSNRHKPMKPVNDDEFQYEFDINPSLTYPAFTGDSAQQELATGGTEQLQDRQMTILQPKCFLCQDQAFPDIQAVKRHWCEHHFVSSAEFHVLRCPMCEHSYTLTKKVTPSIAAETLASFCIHAFTRHSFNFPDYVVHCPCPVLGCVKLFFSGFQFRQHLRSHDLIMTDVSRAEFIVYRKTPETFTHYKCFLCNNDIDHGNILAYFNHWLEKHIYGERLQLQCPECYLLSDVESLKAGLVLGLIVKLALHLSQEHNIEMPSYIVTSSTPTTLPSPPEVSLFHQPLSDDSLTFTPALLDKRARFSVYSCFACRMEFRDSGELLSHWSSVHSADPSDVKCPQCEQTWGTDVDGMEMLADIAQHMHRTHATNIPSHVQRYHCPLLPCSEVFFSSEAVAIHAQLHRLSPVEHNGSLIWRLALLPSHPVFTQYKCFACPSDLDDHGSLVAFLGHWVTQHCHTCAVNSSELQYKCEHCMLNFSFPYLSLSSINLSVVMNSISTYIIHLTDCHDIPLPSFIKKSQHKPRSNIPSDLQLAQLHDRQVTMTRLVCFQCNELQQFLTKKGLYDHWVQHHIEDENVKVNLRCKFCPMTYSSKKSTFQVSRLFTMLSHYCGHLSRAHSLTVEHVLDCYCPVRDCGFLAFALDGLRHHMKIHGWENASSQDLKDGILPLPDDASLLEFRELRCFLCEDESNSEVFPSVLDMVNHFLGNHFTVQVHQCNPKEYSLKCASCLYVSVACMTHVDLFQSWRGIHLLLIHMMRKHDHPVPDFLEQFLCTVNNCAFTAITKKAIEAHERSHVTSISQDIPLEKYGELSYSARKCFLCENHVLQFASDGDLSRHWQVEHMRKENKSLFLQCDQCEIILQSNSASDTLLLVTELFLHRLQEHQSEIPEYIAQLRCLKPGCQFVSFIPQDLKQHEETDHSGDLDIPLHGELQEEEEEESLTQRPSLKSLYEKRPLEMTLTEYICFLCPDSLVHQDLISLTSHVMDVHFDKSEKFNAVLPCPFCFKKYNFKERCKSPVIIMQALSSLVQHMSERHDFVAPNYIKRVVCSQEDCDFQTFTTNRLASHLKHIHGIVDARLGRFKGSSFSKGGNSTQITLTSKLIIKMKRYICFECQANMQREFKTYQEYAIHWREAHYDLDGDRFRHKCSGCSHEYKVVKRKGLEASGILESVSFYFMHLVNKHRMPVPDYVISYECPLPGCSFVTFTLFSVETHCKQKHKALHSRLVEQMEEQGDLLQLQLQSLPAELQQPLPGTSSFGGGQLLTIASDPLQLATFEVAPSLVQNSTFMCLKCGKDFASLLEKNAHVREVHERVKRYLCHMCPDSFSSEESYHEHVFRTHGIARAGEQAFYCDKCSFSTTFQSKLERHIYHKHQMNGATGH
ncbi:hypothetical protein CAPTEDRAFT_227335 [Capitella teleta]|uniref:C2H2-type domain-containing protein n=1 Tax=Capitella teleta TaxID=283909 RepID=R7UJC0_CAPTE|nr:hypothetical protein CAPTEDRAFT_227335 [Capitella teleta]|eukprot:ELU06188.1 hypothetical protein CAPTEDRAFT_227335 [Capitella teleta]